MAERAGQTGVPSLRRGPAGALNPAVRSALLTGGLCARDESARNAGGTPGCGTADGAARRTRGNQTGSPPVPAGPLCRHRACGAPAQREAAAAPAMPVRTRTAGTRVRTVRTGSPAPRPAPCHAAVARAASCPMRSYIYGKTAVCPAGTARWPAEPAVRDPQVASPVLNCPPVRRMPPMRGLAPSSVVVVTGPAELPFSQSVQDCCQ